MAAYVSSLHVVSMMLLAMRRLHLCIKKIARDLEAMADVPTPEAVIELCSLHTLHDCRFPGGFVLLFWLITEGANWIRTIIKEENEVSYG